jgi:hypothetical protein
MSTRFISRQPRYTICLKPSIAGNPALSVPTVPSINIPFFNRIADVEDEKVVEMARKNKSFNVDFYDIDSEEGQRLSKLYVPSMERKHETFSVSSEFSKEKEAGPSSEEIQAMINKSLAAVIPSIVSAVRDAVSPKEKKAPEEQKEPKDGKKAEAAK